MPVPSRLKAEQIQELMDRHSKQYQSPVDPTVWLTEYDYQGIADELNDTIGFVYCRECDHFLENATTHDKKYPHFCSEHGIDMADANGFCAWGRKS